MQVHLYITNSQIEDVFPVGPIVLIPLLRLSFATLPWCHNRYHIYNRKQLLFLRILKVEDRKGLF